MSLVFARRGCAGGKMSVSPLAGTPANPQLALSDQLAVVPDAPDQLKTAASLWLLTSNRAATINRAKRKLAEDAVNLYKNQRPMELFVCIEGSVVVFSCELALTL